eukprot:gnl/Dysnectes_brevis/10127_a19615_160.p1 GENE.gnl/Dysnectes_brevis/10127_a19615_160~~gnl/Dysnectes_brevis/10127_a19615_160.p1  ORF type:complete len:292 (-),score=50.76 gnl/Dysnectes_brevis/10127_a19615_160:40-915(-)
MSSPKITINEDCISCGLCVPACHSFCLKKEEGKVVVIPENPCWACGQCMRVCPKNAISIEGLLPVVERTTHIDGSGVTVRPTAEMAASVLSARYTCRQYKEDKVPPLSVLRDMCTLATAASNGRAMCPWKFTILSSPSAVQHLKNSVSRPPPKPAAGESAPAPSAHDVMFRAWAQRYLSIPGGKPHMEPLYGAPTAILVSTTGPCTAGSGPWPATDAHYAAAQVMLAATGFGLATNEFSRGVMAMAKDKGLRAVYGIPEDHTVHSVIGVGYPRVQNARGCHRVEADINVIE